MIVGQPRDFTVAHPPAHRRVTAAPAMMRRDIALARTYSPASLHAASTTPALLPTHNSHLPPTRRRPLGWIRGLLRPGTHNRPPPARLVAAQRHPAKVPLCWHSIRDPPWPA
ncbi:hypothetical protein Aglo03_46860 [Actinokineospora globicatena]|uniref:Uncharacterized protein n=1 Tax=Actinokineospora globicatena TaxID=103729 RepID=A0A9W6QPZ7_9PSEU|nr:hypothetical protein Aglo03_46860 [Actinokineospora globicatena]